VRRTGRNTSAAQATSGGSDEGREPNGAPTPSKPDPAEPPTAGACAALAGGLYLVATPIGNLGDVSLRSLAVLRAADRIYCEDSRVTARLLARYGIRTPLQTYYDHNAEAIRPIVLAALRRGERVALVSDAGTPLVSDPGYKLVRAAIAENLPVTAAPGPSAALTALILSGLPPDAFLFAGFLPRQQVARRQALARWAALEATLIFYEAPSRLAASLTDISEILGSRQAAVARELTKLHEEVRRGRLADLAGHYRQIGPPRGEIVVVVGPPEPILPDSGEVDLRLRAALAETGVRDAAAKLAAETGLPRAELYRWLARRRARLALPSGRDRHYRPTRRGTRDHRGQVPRGHRRSGDGTRAAPAPPHRARRRSISRHPAGPRRARPPIRSDAGRSGSLAAPLARRLGRRPVEAQPSRPSLCLDGNPLPVHRIRSDLRIPLWP
jgi:16S rRNA (cytidine1402-2'-O)-methyltransferase